MTGDIVAAHGYLMLGSRLKRLGERFQGDVTRLFAAHGFSLQPSQTPILLALEEHETATVGALAAMAGVSQPGITRTVRKLVEDGLIEETDAGGDQRQRTLRLTGSGRAVMRAVHADLFPRVAREVAAMCDGLSGPLLDQIAALEDALATLSLDARVEQPR